MYAWLYSPSRTQRVSGESVHRLSKSPRNESSAVYMAWIPNLEILMTTVDDIRLTLFAFPDPASLGRIRSQTQQVSREWVVGSIHGPNPKPPHDLPSTIYAWLYSPSRTQQVSGESVHRLSKSPGNESSAVYTARIPNLETSSRPPVDDIRLTLFAFPDPASLGRIRPWAQQASRNRVVSNIYILNIDGRLRSESPFSQIYGLSPWKWSWQSPDVVHSPDIRQIVLNCRDSPLSSFGVEYWTTGACPDQ
jgi:hypothetical protein